VPGVDFVLVHGAWGGSWMWSRVARLLREAGHDVFTPSLTGIGERVHLASPQVDLALHTQDVLQVMAHERLSGVVLVGHSYGGMVVTGVADQAAARVASLVYLDAFVPEDGQALVDLARPEMRAALEAEKGWQLPALPPQRQGMTDPAEIAWLEGRRGPQPLGTFTQKVSTRGRYTGPRSYIFCSGYTPSTFSATAAKVRADPAWRYHELPTHHYPQVSMPQETAALLLGAAA
jgi:pimeloyl-ACP methyl ester carboxylesterase